MAMGFSQDAFGDISGVSDPTKDNPPIVNFNFVLRVELLWDIACKSIRIERKENEFDLIQEGGLNDYPHRIRKPITRMFTLRVEQYVGAGFLDPLSLGTKLVLPLVLSVGRYTSPTLFFPDRQYIFTGCEVTAKEPGELQSERSGLLTESTTIAYESMFTIDSPFETEKKIWQFDGFAKSGKGDSSRNKTMEAFELTQNEMTARTQRWSMSKQHGDGSEERTEPSVGSRQNLYLNTTEASANEFAKKHKLWTFDSADAGEYDPMKDRNYQGKGDASRQNIAKNMTDVHKADMKSKASLWTFNPEDEKVKEFDKKSKSGAGKAARQNLRAPFSENAEAARDDLAKKSRRWDFDENDKNNTTPPKGTKGQGTSSRFQYDEETEKKLNPSVEKMRENAKQWEFDPSDATVTDPFAKRHPKGTGDISRQNEKMKAADPDRDTMINAAKQWGFDEKDVNNSGLQNINKKGNEKASAQKQNDEEVSRDNLAKKSSLWTFDPADEGNASPNKNKEGKGNAARQNLRGDYTGIAELSKDQMKDKASLWPPKQSAQNRADFLSGGNK